MQSEESIILELIKTYINTALLGHDVPKVLSLATDDILGVGINEQGVLYSKDHLRRILEAQTPNPDITFHVTFPNYDIRVVGTSAHALVYYDIESTQDGQTTTSSYLQTAGLRKEGGDWKLCYVQAIPKNLPNQTLEQYPLKPDLFSALFEMLNHSLSIGVMASYDDTDDFPAFYINDSMLDLLGYTREELFAFMQQKGSFAPVHPDDVEYVRQELSAASVRGDKEYTIPYRLRRKDGSTRHVVEHGKSIKNDGRDIMISAFVDVTQVKELQLATKQQNETILSSMEYASKIQLNLLPPDSAFKSAYSEHFVFWSPKDIVGGDIYWLQNFSAGSLLCVCDCTGHGIPGALLTTLVTSALDSVVDGESCQDPAKVMYLLDQQIARVLCQSSPKPAGNHRDFMQIQDGCDLALVFTANDGSVSFASSGLRIFICGGNPAEVSLCRGQHLSIGEGLLTSRDQVELTHLPPEPGRTFFLASDGLYDQPGGNPPRPFGYRTIREIILSRHGQPLNEITDAIYAAFLAHQGSEPQRDDIELIAFRI